MRKFRVYTEDSLISINLLDKVTEVVSIRSVSGKNGNIVIDPGNGSSKKEINFERPIILPNNAINEELSSFYKSINFNEPVKVSIEDSIRVLSIAFEIEEKTGL